ncbi:hypothetical protein [Chitinophaga solisilvae]|uniref:hypothetical protein n=1 Tax=Chitinophaga solisilvae TaxID=1233460 RepID=UPI00136EBE95|nr:hypothetical protein [Chitinophaga solisilvae]
MKKKQDKHTEAYGEHSKKPVEILDTDKGSTTRNPLHGSLSDKPEKENKTVRDSEKDKRH